MPKSSRPMKLQTLAKMSPAEREEALASIVSASMGPRNGQMSWADVKVADFEKKYDMTTEQMRAGFRAGTIGDTPDIAQWLILAPR